MKVLQIGADRSKRGILYEGSPAFLRQQEYAKRFGQLDIIGFSRVSDGAKKVIRGTLTIHPTNSRSRWVYMRDALRIVKTLPKPDVVSAQDPFETGLVGWWIARKYQVPLHVQVHTDFLSPEYRRHSATNRIRVFLAGFVLRRAAGIRAVSDRIQESIQERYRPDVPVTVLPIFVDVGQFRNAIPDAALAGRFRSFATKLLVVSRLEAEKNVQLALRAFAASAPLDSCLIIVGAGSEETSFKHFAKRLNVAERVFFEGPRDVAPYYQLADVVLVPSRYEGYGLVTVEALAGGVPVLSTDVGIAREAGAIVTTEEKFADALAEWFKNGPRTGELKNYPYKSFDEYVRAYSEDIESCVKAQKGHTTAI